MITKLSTHIANATPGRPPFPWMRTILLIIASTVAVALMELTALVWVMGSVRAVMG